MCLYIVLMKQQSAHTRFLPQNIFLDSEWNVKVGDFGLSLRYLPDRKANDPVGSLIYASPEVLRRESYVGPELDVWALGILRTSPRSPHLATSSSASLRNSKLI